MKDLNERITFKPSTNGLLRNPFAIHLGAAVFLCMPRPANLLAGTASPQILLTIAQLRRALEYEPPRTPARAPHRCGAAAETRDDSDLSYVQIIFCTGHFSCHNAGF